MKGSKTPVAPWPDAFEPRKNFKRPGGSRSWSWLLLIPLGAVAAIGAATLDPRMIRAFVDQQLLHFRPQPTTDAPSLLPGPFRPGNTTAAPSAPAPVVAPRVESAPVAIPPVAAVTDEPPTPAAPQAVAEAAQIAPPPAVETPPVAVAAPTVNDAPAPPASEPTSAQVTVAPTAAQAASDVPTPGRTTEARLARIAIVYRRGVGTAEAEARRLAVRLNSTAKTVELRAVGTTMHSPVLTYYNQADKDEATSLARSLAGVGGVWIIRQGPARAAGTVELSLP